MRVLHSVSYLSLPWCWRGAGSRTSMRGTRGSKLLRRGNGQCKGQEGEVVWWGGQDVERIGFFFCAVPWQGLRTLCTPMHLLWCDLLIPKTMSKWLAKGWKRQVTIQIFLHPFMAIRAAGMMRWRVAVECYKPFRRCLLHCCSFSWIT